MFPFNEIPLQKKAPFQLYDQIQNPIFSKNDDYPPFLSNFPSPFFDEHELLPLNQILPIFNSKPTPNPNPTTLPSNPNPTKKEAPPRRRSVVAAAAPRKRTGKKDRHSKICTAQGIRDRRMRLSLQVARKFFDLQDMLGYDKASKTIEWLFIKSKKAIMDLAKDTSAPPGFSNNVSMSDGKSESLVSECEVLSGNEENNCEIKEDYKNLDDDDDDDDDEEEKKSSKRAVCSKPKSRESREKARARARCRTEEKMMMMTLGKQQQKLGSFVHGDAADYSPLLHPPSTDVGTIEKLLGSSSSSSDFANTNFMGFLGSWDLLSNDRIMTTASDSMPAAAAAGTHDFPFFHQ